MSEGDFHLHSNYSDGIHPPATIVRMAAEGGVRWMALTDHDTTDGLVEAAAAAGRVDIKLMPGIEISTDMDGVDCHLLALGLRWHDDAWQAFLADQRDGRLGRLERMVEILAGEGVPVRAQRVLEIAGESSVGRPHVARALMEAGYVESVAEAFDRWLGNGKVADVPREKLTPDEAIGRVHDLGGIVVVAHPPFMGPDYAVRVRALRGAGADGIETFYKNYPPEVVSALFSLCEETGAVASGGSDYHGLGNPDDRPVGGFEFPAEHLRRFIAYCEDHCAIPWIEEVPVA